MEDYVRSADDFAELERRAKHGNRGDFERFMAKVPDAPPMPGDELPRD